MHTQCIFKNLPSAVLTQCSIHSQIGIKMIVFIHGMSSISSTACQTLLPFIFKEADGDSDISIGEWHGEWMKINIDTSVVFMKSNCLAIFQQLPAVCQLEMTLSVNSVKNIRTRMNFEVHEAVDRTQFLDEGRRGCDISMADSEILLVDVPLVDPCQCYADLHVVICHHCCHCCHHCCYHCVIAILVVAMATLRDITTVIVYGQTSGGRGNT